MKNNFLRLFILLLAGVLPVCAAAFSRELPDTIQRKGPHSIDLEKDTINLDMVVVTGTRSNRQLKNSPVQIRVITENDIKRSGNNKVEDILAKELSGVEFHQAGYGTTMNFQGLDARHVLVLLDGERISGDTNGNIDFSRIPTETIQRIEVIKGSSSVLYGSSAMGATINIITKRPRRDIEGSVYYNFGGYNQRNPKETKNGIKADIPNMTAAGYLGINRNDRFISSTDFTYQSSDPYRLVSKREEKRHYVTINGNMVDKNIYVPVDSSGISISGWQSITLNQKLEYRFSPKVTARARGGYYWRNRYDLGKYTSAVYDNPTIPPIENYQGYNIDADVDYAINTGNRLVFSIHDTNASRDEKDMGKLTPKQRNNIITGRILYHNSSIKGNNITAGMEYYHESLNLDLTSEGVDKQYRYNTFAVFVQDDAQITQRLALVGGLRIENYGFSSAQGFWNNFFVPSKSEKGGGASVTPQLALNYKINRTTLRFNYAMGFRNPSLKERYMVYFQPYMNMTIVGNPDLKPERNHYFSVSGDYLSPNNGLYVSGNIYANLFKDKIDTYHNPEKDELIYMNTAKSELYGADVSGRIRLLSGWWLNANYAYNYRHESGPVNSAQYIFSSPHTAVLSTSYTRRVNHWELGGTVSVSYYSGKKYQDMMPTIIRYPDQLIPEVIEGTYEGYLEGYALCNLSLTASYKNRWTFSAGVNNFLNYTPTIASFNSAFTPGITGYFSVRVSF